MPPSFGLKSNFKLGLGFGGHVRFCHCTDCRKFSGSAFSAFGGVAKSLLTVSKGKSDIERFEKSEDSVLCFCKRCGSSLFSEKPLSGLIHIRLGVLAGSPSLKPQAHIFVSSKVDWYKVSDGLPQFERMPTGG